MKIIKTLVFTLKTLFKIDSFDMGLVIFLRYYPELHPLLQFK